MVGAVIVHNNIIIGEGYHQEYGGSHAEVNAINSVQNKSLLKEATIYVSLEPCSHFGKTPPCADLIIKHQIPKVVIATIDSNAIVCGNGISKLKNAGIEVLTGVLENEANHLNKYFNTFHQEKRPFVILKWAETADGFIDHKRNKTNTKPLRISNSSSSRWVHKLRSEVDAILVGKNTALLDNPSLTTRKWSGKDPIRVLIDPQLTLPDTLKIFDGSVKTFVFNFKKNSTSKNLEYLRLDESKEVIPQLLNLLWRKKIQSILVEGGAFTLQQFIDTNTFDEAFTIKSPDTIFEGVRAPVIKQQATKINLINENKIIYYA